MKAFHRSLILVLLVIGSSTVYVISSSEFAPEFEVGSANIILRDSITGKMIEGQISSILNGDAVRTVTTDMAGRAGHKLAAGRNDLEITANGYSPIKTYFIAEQKSLDITVWLDPMDTPWQMRTDDIESNLRDGSTLIHGHVVDIDTGEPLQNATVYLEGRNNPVMSDADGYFRMFVPTPPVDPVGDLPASADLIVEFAGKVVYRRTNTMIPAGAVHFIIDVDRDTFTQKDGTHKLRLSPDELSKIQSEPPVVFEPENRLDQAGSVVVPSSIRVGSNCPSGRTSCTVFSVYTLDTYVRFGLDDEWISSWNANSLKAGSIAFRSYGVYHIFHPINAANYDICNTTSCQVMDPTDSATSTNNATTQTTGSIVVDAARSNVFFAEYSAENNLGGCPDGYTGNNGTWPCLTDAVDAGQTFNGHGRGMCQWGSQRWSINQGKDFVWIVNHYYNGNDNPSGLRTGYLQMSVETLLPPPSLAAPGGTTAPGPAVTTLTPTFQWEPVEGADGYSLYVSKLNGTTYDLIFNSETAIGEPISGTTYTLPAGILQANGQYRWNMSAHINAGYGTPNTFRNYFSVSPTATLSGRVMTPDGRSLRNATVALTDDQGVRTIATTSSFGIFGFQGVMIGRTYTITVSSKRYRFAPLTVDLTGDLTLSDIIGLE